MPETLAQRIKAKYPGVYDHLAEADLETRILKKYPGVYDHLPRSTTASQAPTARPQAANTPSVPDTWSQRLGLNDPTASPKEGFIRGSAGAAVDMAEGAVSGLANTVFHGGDLIRRGTNAAMTAVLGPKEKTLSDLVTGRQPQYVERVIDTPEAQQAMRAPNSFAGKTGRFLEQGAEFALPLSKVSKSAAALSWVPRMAVEGAAGAGVAGVQSGGDPQQMAIGAAAPAVLSAGANLVKAGAGAAVRAANGAAEGGLGGAVASVVRGVAQSEPKQMVIQALKPRNSRINFARNLDTAIPDVAEAIKASGKPVTNLDDLLERIKFAKKRVRVEYDALADPARQTSAPMDLGSVADAIEASIPRRSRIMDARKVEAAQAMADAYRNGKFTLDDAESLLREVNADLEAYYSKFPAARANAAATNPETAQAVAEATELRKAIYTAMDGVGGGDAARSIQRRYGALIEMEDAAHRRANVAARQQPESLSEQIGKVRAAADMARGTWRILHGDFTGAADIAAARAGASTAKYLKDQQTTDALIRRAFANVKIPDPRPIKGLLPPATIRLGPGEDTSFVRGVRGEYATVEKPPQKALPRKSQGPEMPSGGNPIQMGPDRWPYTPSESGGTSVRGEYGTRVPVSPSDIGMTVEPVPSEVPTPSSRPQQGALPGRPTRLELPEGTRPEATSDATAPRATQSQAPAEPATPAVTPSGQNATPREFAAFYEAASPSERKMLEDGAEIADVMRARQASAMPNAPVGPTPLTRDEWLAQVGDPAQTRNEAKSLLAEADRLYGTIRNKLYRADGKTLRKNASPDAQSIMQEVNALRARAREMEQRAYDQQVIHDDPHSHMRPERMSGARQIYTAFGRDHARAGAALKAYETATKPPTTPVAASGPTPSVVKPVAPSAPVASVDDAARKTAQQIEHVVNVQGAKNGAEVHRRVLQTLDGALEDARKATGISQVEYTKYGRTGGARVHVNGVTVAEFDRYGNGKWAGYISPDEEAKLGLEGVDLTDAANKMSGIARGGDASPKEFEREATLRATTALSRVKKLGQIVVRIPGDGTFTVERNPYAIQTLIDRVKSGGPAVWKDIAKRESGAARRPTR